MATSNTDPASASGGLTNALRDIKPPVEIPTGLLWLAWTVAALVLAALLYAFWKHQQKRRLAAALAPPIPPHVRARRKLQEALALIGQPRPFCIMVSDALRVYLEERFEFRAPERTTEEFLHELQATRLLSAEQKQSLGEFLQQCDLVKFARHEPHQAELQQLHQSALRLVDETEPALVALHEAQAGLQNESARPENRS